MSGARRGPVANDAQIEHWAGPGGAHWTTHEERLDRMLAPYGARVVEAVAARPGERILDVGCGNGALALALAPQVAPDGEVTGVDISTPMLERARQRATDAGQGACSFLEADAQVHPFEPGAYDALVSRFGVMFFDDPTTAFTNLARALRPGGRMAFVCWRDPSVNEWLLVSMGALLEHVPPPPPRPLDAPGPYAFADPERVRSILGTAGLTDVALTEVDEPTWMGESGEDAVTFLQGTELSRTLFAGVDDATAARAWAAVTDALVAREGPDGVVLAGGAWLVTARRP